jgi:hypothetical protein
VPEQDLDIEHDTLGHLCAEGLVEAVDLGGDERGLVLTKRGRDLLDSQTLERDNEAPQAFYAGISRSREINHDSSLYSTYRQEEARLPRRARRPRHPARHSRAGLEARVSGIPAGSQPQPAPQRRPTRPR